MMMMIWQRYILDDDDIDDIDDGNDKLKILFVLTLMLTM